MKQTTVTFCAQNLQTFLVRCSRDFRLFSHKTFLEEMIKLSFNLGNSNISSFTLSNTTPATVVSKSKLHITFLFYIQFIIDYYRLLLLYIAPLNHPDFVSLIGFISNKLPNTVNYLFVVCQIFIFPFTLTTT